MASAILIFTISASSHLIALFAKCIDRRSDPYLNRCHQTQPVLALDVTAVLIAM